MKNRFLIEVKLLTTSQSIIIFNKNHKLSKKHFKKQISYRASVYDWIKFIPYHSNYIENGFKFSFIF